MAWTTPSTAVAGSTALTAAFWNQQVRDNTNALYDSVRRLGYVERTTGSFTVPYSVSAPGANEFFPNDLSFTADGTSTYIVEFFSPGGYSSVDIGTYYNLCTGSGTLVTTAAIRSGTGYLTPYFKYFYTPSAGTVTLNLRPHKDTNTGTAIILAGDNTPPGVSDPPPAWMAVFGPALS
jgi:hypothetical protein